MKKITWINAVSGGVSGFLGAFLVNQFGFSLFSVVIIGMLIGVITAFLFKIK